HLGRDVALLPLPVGKAMLFGPAEHHERVRGGPDFRVPLLRIPEEVAGHEHVVLVAELPIQTFLDRDDVLELKRVFGNGFTIAVGVNDGIRSSETGNGHRKLSPRRWPEHLWIKLPAL